MALYLEDFQNNIFALFTDDQTGLPNIDAHKEVFAAMMSGDIEKLAKAMFLWADEGASDTAAEEQIMKYWRQNHPDKADQSIWHTHVNNMLKQEGVSDTIESLMEVGFSKEDAQVIVRTNAPIIANA